MSELTTRSGAVVSRFCFGAMQFGGRADERASVAMYEASRQAGINFFDTAFAYTDGNSQRILGSLVGKERDDIYLATKIAASGGAGAENIQKQFDVCRSLLGMDVVDALYLHRWDDETALEETFQAMVKLQLKGQIRHIGVSNYAAWQVMKAQAVAARMGARIELIQPMYNLVKRQVEVEILPMAMDQDISVASYSPLGGGLLTGKYRNGSDGRLKQDDMYAARYGQEWMYQAASDLCDIADELEVSPATLAVSWVARNPAITHPIISARTEEQLRPSLAAMAFEMDDTLYNRITALSPTPAPATDRLEEQG